MTSPPFSPCPEWAEPLALAHSTELSPTDRAALEVHLVSCPTCQAVLEEYRAFDERLHTALLAQEPLQLSSELLYMEEEAEPFRGRSRGKPPLRMRTLQRKSPLPSSLSFAGRVFNTLVAILVIGVLISGFLALYSMTRGFHGLGTHPSPTALPWIHVTPVAPLVPPSTPTGNSAFVRVIDASPFVGSVDVFVDGTKLLTSFVFGSVTDYVPIPQGSHKVQIALVGKGVGAAALTQTLSVQPDLTYTIVSVGNQATGLSLEEFMDNNHLVAGKAKMRFYDLFPTSDPLVVSASDRILIHDLSYKSVSSYLDLSEGQYSFRLALNQSQTLQTAPLAIQANTVMSIFLIDSLDGTSQLQLVLAQVTALPNVCNC